jgi:L-ascorbate metabolism protein UlaG (beta-lactamase superfamily)
MRWAFVVSIVVTLASVGVAHAGCTPIALGQPGIRPVSDTDETVRITFLGHASFEIESPAGVRAVTDYNGVNVPAEPPDIATMNHAHATHYTLHPDPRIPHVLHGWAEDGQPPVYDLTVRDMHVSNLPTNIRNIGGETERYGNSIFVFETAGLCIAHLSHLHHLLEPADVKALGHVDIVMIAVDGTWTMSQPDAVRVIGQIQPRVVLPMHYITRDVLAHFLELARETYAIEIHDSPDLAISRAALPPEPTVIALPGHY